MSNSRELVPLTDQSREGMSPIKWRAFVQATLRGKGPRIDAYLDSVLDLEPTALAALTGKRFENIIFDVDGCLVGPYGKQIPAKHIAHVEGLLRRGIRAGILSNAKASRRLDPLRELGVPVFQGKYSKPDPRAFVEACEQFEFDRESTWMIDDDPNVGCWAGQHPHDVGISKTVLAGSILVRPVPARFRGLSLWEILKTAKAFPRAVAIRNTLKGNPQAVTSKQIRAYLTGK